MREVTMSEFNFSNEMQRETLSKDKEFTFGHYKIGDGSATIAGGRLGEYLYYGISLCSPEDNFSRMTGRDFAVDHLIFDQFSGKRGRMFINSELLDSAPAIVLKTALERHLNKMRQRSSWMKNTVTFRTNKD